MVTIQEAAIYSTGGAMAFELTYSEGTKVRAIQTRDGWIRKEARDAAGNWGVVGKPYSVKSTAGRAAESIKASAIAFLN